MINLPNVTLVIAETRAHDLARITINDFISKVSFGDIMIYSNDCSRITVPGAQYMDVPDWSNKIASGSFYYTEAARTISTSHALLMEWDAGVCNPDMWRDEFLEYDYIGAPWEWRVNLDKAVGNGGFALMTKRLADFCSSEKLKIATDMDISVHCRREIETRGGFKWAPPEVARDFAYEGWTPHGPSRDTVRPNSFGYHGVFNWPRVLDRADLLTRASLLFDSVQSWTPGKGSAKVNLLLGAAPWLRQELKVPMQPLHTHNIRSLREINLLRQQRAIVNRGLRA